MARFAKVSLLIDALPLDSTGASPPTGGIAFNSTYYCVQYTDYSYSYELFASATSRICSQSDLYCNVYSYMTSGNTSLATSMIGMCPTYKAMCTAMTDANTAKLTPLICVGFGFSFAAIICFCVKKWGEMDALIDAKFNPFTYSLSIFFILLIQSIMCIVASATISLAQQPFSDSNVPSSMFTSSAGASALGWVGSVIILLSCLAAVRSSYHFRGLSNKVGWEAENSKLTPAEREEADKLKREFEKRQLAAEMAGGGMGKSLLAPVESLQQASKLAEEGKAGVVDLDDFKLDDELENGNGEAVNRIEGGEDHSVKEVNKGGKKGSSFANDDDDLDDDFFDIGGRKKKGKAKKRGGKSFDFDADANGDFNDFKGPSKKGKGGKAKKNDFDFEF